MKILTTGTNAQIYSRLQKYATKHGYSVKTFSTHGTNFYENAVLCICLPESSNRNQSSVLEYWDVSYSIGTQSPISKWGTALRGCAYYINNHRDILRIINQSITNHKINRATRIKTNRIANKTANEKLLQDYETLLNSDKITPVEAVKRGLVAESLLQTFGMDEAEREHLINEASIILIGNTPVIEQITMSNGRGLYKISSSPYDNPIVRAPRSLQPEAFK